MENEEGLYAGTLSDYMRVILEAPNIYHGYHGLRHMLHVLWSAHEAVRWYHDRAMLSRRRARNLLIAALFHDYGHTGAVVEDYKNIARAIRGLHAYIQPEDRAHLKEISDIIRASEFPHRDLGPNETLEQRILRDADVSQAFGKVWMGDILAGLGSELGKTPIEMLEGQLVFLEKLQFHSEYFQEIFGKKAIEEKKAETKAILAMC